MPQREQRPTCCGRKARYIGKHQDESIYCCTVCGIRFFAQKSKPEQFFSSSKNTLVIPGEVSQESASPPKEKRPSTAIEERSHRNGSPLGTAKFAAGSRTLAKDRCNDGS
jgi:hypothetical protein